MGSDVVVVGGGIIGASCAYALAKNGASVALLEKRNFGSGASGCTAAMLECQTYAFRGDPFMSLAKPSLDLFPKWYEEIKEETGQDFEYEQCGILNLAMTDQEECFYRSCVEDQKRKGFKTEWMDREQIEKEFPQIEPNYVGGAFYKEDGQVNGEKFLQSVLEAARRQGVVAEENVGDVYIGYDKNGLKAVTSNDVYEADNFVVSAGAWTNQVLSFLHFHLDIVPVRGQLAYFDTGTQNQLKSPIFSLTHGYVVPKRCGYTIVGTTAEDVGFDESTTEEAREQLVQKAWRLTPNLVRQRFRGMGAGLRPMAMDELPIIGALAAYPNIFISTGHFRNGILLTPITAEVVTSLVFKENPPINIDAFSPSRFMFKKVFE